MLKFVVTGASKRGWTTWLTAVVDKRVIAIAPMVIDMLNIPAQIPNQLKQWGQFSIQIVDYTRRGLVQPENQTDRHARLWEMVDPYSYRDRLKIPKLIILGTNDPYWTLNALDLYWHGLTGIKHVLYVPNAGHSLDTPSNYAYSAVRSEEHTSELQSLVNLVCRLLLEKKKNIQKTKKKKIKI